MSAPQAHEIGIFQKSLKIEENWKGDWATLLQVADANPAPAQLPLSRPTDHSERRAILAVDCAKDSTIWASASWNTSLLTSFTPIIGVIPTFESSPADEICAAVLVAALMASCP